MRQQQLRNQEFSVIILISGVDVGAALFQFLTQDSLSAREGYPLWLIIIGG
jgi:hypothetical protein